MNSLGIVLFYGISILIIFILLWWARREAKQMLKDKMKGGKK